MDGLSKAVVSIAASVFAVSGIVNTVVARAAVPVTTTFAVTTTNDLDDYDIDDGICNDQPPGGGTECSLRAAIEQANALPAQSTINITVPNGTYALTLGSLFINGGRTIGVRGSSSSGTVITAGNQFTPFYVYSEAVVTISTTTIMGGYTSGSGGAIVNTGTLTLSGDVLSHNAALNGGAIYNDGTLSITTSSVISNNTATVAGGGLYNVAGNTATVTQSSFSANNALTGAGGGIYNNGTVTLSKTTVSVNSASLNGGGIANAGSLHATTSTAITSNNSTQRGGGLFNSGNATVDGQTTVNSNTANSAAGIANIGVLTVSTVTVSLNASSGIAGGILNDVPGTATLTNCTMKNNRAAANGGAIDNLNPASGAMTVSAGTLSDNTALDGAAVANGGNLALSGTAVTNNLTAPNGYGGGFYNTGTLSLSAVNVGHNSAQQSGGGVYQKSPGVLTISAGSTLVANSAVLGDGGGIANGSSTGDVGGSVTINQSTIATNTAKNNGGGVFTAPTPVGQPPVVTITGATLQTNTARAGAGGGVYMGAGSATLTVTLGVFSTNFAQTQGGGIDIEKKVTATVMTTTLDANRAAGANGQGAGIWVGGTLALSASTLSHNVTPARGGGLFVNGTATVVNSTLSANTGQYGGAVSESNSGTLTINSTTISGNTASVGGSAFYDSGKTVLLASIIGDSASGSKVSCNNTTITDNGYNLDADGSCGLSGKSLRHVEPHLGALANNGGPTLTQLPAVGSRVIQYVPLASCPSTDQRGVARPGHGGSKFCDIGSVETDYTERG